MVDKKDNIETLASFFKDQFILLGILILFVGLCSLDAYYSSFGIRFQFLDLSNSHIIYRGVQLLFEKYYIIAAYLILIIWQVLDNFFIKKGYKFYLEKRVLFGYTLIASLFIISYYTANAIGRQIGSEDMYEETSRLPEIINIMDNSLPQDFFVSNPFTKTSNFRLLLIDNDFVIIFKPLNLTKDGKEAFPNILRLPKGDVKFIETNSHL